MTRRIAVVGTGYLGTTHAAGMAELGHDVVGLDVDPDKVRSLSAGRVPFYEPGLPELIDRHVGSGRLRFTTSVAEAARADVVFLCVGTPQQPGGQAADLRYLHRAVDALVPQLTRSTLLVGKSTVPVGTATGLAARAQRLAGPGVHVEVAWNPEFLREGQAVRDTLAPDRLVLGVTSAEAEIVLTAVYDRLLRDGVPLVVTDLPTAELVKVSANAFLATKISFINAMAELSDAAGADVVALADALGHDRRIGRSFLDAGLGFGGGCLPKDLRALAARGRELGRPDSVAFLDEVDAINRRRRTDVVERAARLVGGSAAGRRIAVLGAAFKPDSDDVRDSPALEVAVRLHRAGAVVRVHDPQAIGTARSVAPELTYLPDLSEAARSADLVLHLTDWAEYRALDPTDLAGLVRRRVVLDARNRLPRSQWVAAGWEFHGLGRPGTDRASDPADDPAALAWVV